MTPAGAPGTAGRGFRIPAKEGRHRAPPDPPPPDRWTAPIGAAAALLTGLSLIAIVAPGFGYDATATDRGVTVSTASRTARTVHIPLTVLPAPVPTIGAAGAWDPETAPTEITLSRPTPFAGVQGHAAAPVTTAAGLTEVTQATEATTERPPTTLPGVATTDSTTEPTSPASTSEAAATDSSAPTSTEETTPMTTEPTQTAEPTDVIGDVTDAIEEVGP